MAERKRTSFLEALATSGDVAAAVRTAKLTITGVYKVRRQNPAFAAAWDAAMEQASARLEDLLLARALATAAGEGPALSERGLLAMLNRRRPPERQKRGEDGTGEAAEGGADLRERLEASLAEMHARLAAGRE